MLHNNAWRFSHTESVRRGISSFADHLGSGLGDTASLSVTRWNSAKFLAPARKIPKFSSSLLACFAMLCFAVAPLDHGCTRLHRRPSLGRATWQGYATDSVFMLLTQPNTATMKRRTFLTGRVWSPRRDDGSTGLQISLLPTNARNPCCRS